MNVKAALKRLEDAEGVGRRCLNCRVHYIKFGDEIRRTAEADLFVTTCGACGRELKLILSGFTPREREVVISISTVPAPEHESAGWVASYAWIHNHPRYLEVERIGEAEEKRLRGLKGHPHARRQVKTLDEHERFKEGVMSVRGDDAPLPPAWREVFDAFDAVKAGRGAEPMLKDEKFYAYTVMAAMEVFMWGEKSEGTLNLIKDRRAERVREARELLERLEREKVEREERYRREAEERRRKSEERERQRRERMRAAEEPAPAPVRTPEKESGEWLRDYRPPWLSGETAADPRAPGSSSKARRCRPAKVVQSTIRTTRTPCGFNARLLRSAMNAAITAATTTTATRVTEQGYARF